MKNCYRSIDGYPIGIKRPANVDKPPPYVRTLLHIYEIYELLIVETDSNKDFGN